MNSERVATGVQKSALKKAMEALEEKEREIYQHEKELDFINSDEPFILKDDITPSAVNYVMGQSAGFVRGINAAINTIVLALSSEYRDIPMTESELYMLVELGEQKERALLKDRKQENLLEKQGWKAEYKGRVQVWKKEESEQGGKE